MPKYAARKARVLLASSASGTATPISLAEWTLNMPTDKIEVTSFGDENKTYVQGLPDLTGTLSGFWDSADSKLFDASDSPDGAKLYLYPSMDASGIYFAGPAWLDASITCSVNGAVSISANFSAAGSWVKKLT